MTHTKIRVGLVALLISLCRPQVLLGLDPAPSARLFSCNTPQRDAGPDWLVRRGSSGEQGAILHFGPAECHRCTPALTMELGELMRTEPGRSTSASKHNAWKQAGIYGIEFAGAAAASSAGVAGALWAAAALSNKSDVFYVPAVAVAYGGSVISSVVLSALGTHIMGGLLGQRGAFSHALAGGAIGGVAGGVVLLASTTSKSWPLFSVGLALPAAGAVTSYNIWRNNETR